MRKSLLKILMGLVGAILGYAIVSAVYEFRHTQTPPDARLALNARLARVAANMNERLPLLADPETRLDKVTAGPGAQLTYAFTLPNRDKGTLDLPAFEKAIRQNLINNYQTNSSLAELRAAQVKLDYQYKDKNGQFISEIAVTPKDF
ncbi:MAG: hypothetical protein P4N60_09035 [Verrucomicrobiae bacterium]|nr:hypothetical protein [Verrucomicrobiae bacterium]